MFLNFNIFGLPPWEDGSDRICNKNCTPALVPVWRIRYHWTVTRLRVLPLAQGWFYVNKKSHFWHQSILLHLKFKWDVCWNVFPSFQGTIKKKMIATICKKHVAFLCVCPAHWKQNGSAVHAVCTLSIKCDRPMVLCLEILREHRWSDDILQHVKKKKMHWR